MMVFNIFFIIVVLIILFIFKDPKDTVNMKEQGMEIAAGLYKKAKDGKIPYVINSIPPEIRGIANIFLSA